MNKEWIIYLSQEVSPEYPLTSFHPATGFVAPGISLRMAVKFPHIFLIT